MTVQMKNDPAVVQRLLRSPGIVAQIADSLATMADGIATAIESQPDPCPPHKISEATEGPWVGRCVKCGAKP